MKMSDFLTPTAGESDDDYDGVLSTYAEWHAAWTGVYYGLIHIRPHGLPPRARENADVVKEPHYAKGGYVVGYMSRLLILGGLYLAGVKTGALPVPV